LIAVGAVLLLVGLCYMHVWLKARGRMGVRRAPPPLAAEQSARLPPRAPSGVQFVGLDELSGMAERTPAADATSDTHWVATTDHDDPGTAARVAERSRHISRNRRASRRTDASSSARDESTRRSQKLRWSAGSNDLAPDRSISVSGRDRSTSTWETVKRGTAHLARSMGLRSVQSEAPDISGASSKTLLALLGLGGSTAQGGFDLFERHDPTSAIAATAEPPAPAPAPLQPEDDIEAALQLQRNSEGRERRRSLLSAMSSTMSSRRASGSDDDDGLLPPSASGAFGRLGSWREMGSGRGSWSEAAGSIGAPLSFRRTTSAPLVRETRKLAECAERADCFLLHSSMDAARLGRVRAAGPDAGPLPERGGWGALRHSLADPGVCIPTGDCPRQKSTPGDLMLSSASWLNWSTRLREPHHRDSAQSMKEHSHGSRIRHFALAATRSSRECRAHTRKGAASTRMCSSSTRETRGSTSSLAETTLVKLAETSTGSAAASAAAAGAGGCSAHELWQRRFSDPNPVPPADAGAAPRGGPTGPAGPGEAIAPAAAAPSAACGVTSALPAPVPVTRLGGVAAAAAQGDPQDDPMAAWKARWGHPNVRASATGPCGSAALEPSDSASTLDITPRHGFGRESLYSSHI
jgi:hypothetical protein